MDSLQAATPWSGKAAYLGNKTCTETRIDLRGYELNVDLIPTA